MSLPNNSALKKATTSTTGATDSPYLGSKISLVSKAKIRYEGILYTIDANESTVALSKVRSFGTEDRPTDRPVHARDEIFEYIIFRGADIEDLQVREPPQSSFTHDPAIVESSMYPANARSNTVGSNLGGTSQTGQTRSSSNQGTMPSPPTQQGSGKGHKLSSITDPLRQLNINQQQSSRPYSQQSPAAQLDGQDFSYGNGQRRGRQQQQQQQRQDYYDDFSGNSTGRRANQNYGYAEWPRVGGGAAWDASWGNGGNGYRQPQRYSRGQANFYPQRRFNNGQQQANGYYGNERSYGYRQRRNSTGGITGTDDQDGNQQQQRGNRQQQQQQQQQQRERANSTRGNGSNNRTALKFIGDFDFEKSNAEFDKNAIEDEIKKSLSIKTSKGETSDDTPKSPNKDTMKTDDSTPATQQEKENQQQHPISSSSQSEQEISTDGYYDKQKSFFDRISCEATEKERTNARRNWNEERRVNAETFGLKYRPVQQGGNGGYQRGGGQAGYYNNNRRNNNTNGQQTYYGNGGRYPRGGGYGGQQQRGRGGSSQGYGRNTMYYGNSNNRMRAY